MLDGSPSGAEDALQAVLVGDEVEALPDVHATFVDLHRADPARIGRLDEAGALRAIAACEQQIAQLQATQLRAMARLGALRDDPRSVTAEVALTTSTTEARARNQLALAETLTTRLPRTLAAMDAGTIDAYKAGKVADATSPLDDATAGHADAALDGRLDGKNPTALRQAAGRVVARLDPDGADRRAAERRRDRRVDLIQHGDGLATLSADLPAETAQALYTRIDRAARANHGPGEDRTLDQLRADLLAAHCLGTTSRDSAINTTPQTGPARAEVFLHISADTLAGATDDPAELAGHGPLPAAIARAIAHEPTSTWRRIITDPIDGQILDVGRTRYRPPAALDDYVRIRDRTCRHPGCHRPSHHGDLDHHTAWSTADGHTSAANLIGFCRNHHRLKDRPGWTHQLDNTGTLTVTTPTRQHYTSTADPPPF